MPDEALSERQADFREAMARLSAAVHIITTDGPAGRAGITASAVASVTDDPPTLLLCLNRRSRVNPIFKANGVVAVSTLRAGQEDLSAIFASSRGTPMAERFPDERWTKLATGSPVLRDGLVAFDGRIVAVQEVGTHSVFFVEVTETAVGEPGPALVYYRRSYSAVHHG
jgi:flavin reductase